MKVWEEEEKVQCVYYATHSHKLNSNNFVHHPLPESSSAFINNRLSWGVSSTKVFQTVRKNLVDSDSRKNIAQYLTAKTVNKKNSLERDLAK